MIHENPVNTVNVANTANTADAVMPCTCAVLLCFTQTRSRCCCSLLHAADPKRQSSPTLALASRRDRKPTVASAWLGSLPLGSPRTCISFRHEGSHSHLRAMRTDDSRTTPSTRVRWYRGTEGPVDVEYSTALPSLSLAPSSSLHCWLRSCALSSLWPTRCGARSSVGELRSMLHSTQRNG